MEIITDEPLGDVGGRFDLSETEERKEIRRHVTVLHQSVFKEAMLVGVWLASHQLVSPDYCGIINVPDRAGAPCHEIPASDTSFHCLGRTGRYHRR